ncbi:MAG: hypothetical protein ACFFC7_09590 [Candidatus Hermodarchaeota archaeon]
MERTIKILLAIIIVIVIVAASIVGVWFLFFRDDGTSEETKIYPIYNAQQMEAFLTMKATLKDSTTDSVALNMANKARNWIDTLDPFYTNASYHLPKPAIKYFALDYFGRKTESHYLVWLPPNWQSLPIKKAFVYSHGHVADEPKRFTRLHLFAKNHSMAIFGPQMWLETEQVPEGYTEFVRDQEHINMGVQPGYHLDAKDEHLFINAIIEEYNIDSLYLEGFSSGGSIVTMLAAFDHLSNNITDFVTIDGGLFSMEEPATASFMAEMKDLGYKGTYFMGENFFLFTELEHGETATDVKNQVPTDDNIIANGGTLVMEEYWEAGHGDLLLKEDFWPLFDTSIIEYHQIVFDRLHP